jgi:hypothetical protein
MSGPDNMTYDSTGAGEFVRGTDINAARPGNLAKVPDSVVGGSADMGIGDKSASPSGPAPQGTPPGGGSPEAARDGGVQRIPS